jgi:hypothetical protein
VDRRQLIESQRTSGCFASETAPCRERRRRLTPARTAANRSMLGPHPRGRVLYELGVRLITFDRPGYGGSDRIVSRLLADVAPDVHAIADELGVDRFAVLGKPLRPDGEAHRPVRRRERKAYRNDSRRLSRDIASDLVFRDVGHFSVL